MKILFIVPSLGMGGMEKVLVTYANLFARKGYDVTVYNLTYDDSDVVFSFDERVHYHRGYMPVPHLFNSKLKDILKLNFRIRPFGAWINFHSAKFLHGKYVKGNFDIEVAFFGFTSIKIVGGAHQGTKKIGWIHGEQKFNDFSPIINTKEAINVFNTIDKYICVSQGAMDSVATVYKRIDDLYVVNNPIDTKYIRQLANDMQGVPNKKNFTFVNASRFDDNQKGFSRLLRVCKKLKDEGFLFDFWLIGGGIDYNKITNLAKDYNLDNIMFFGQQKNPYKYIANADMYVCSSYSEGFSIVMIETVALATPILSTDVPGASEMLDNGKYGLIVKNSEEAIYIGMKDILTKKGLYDYYRKMAVQRKDYLSEEKIMYDLESIILN